MENEEQTPQNNQGGVLMEIFYEDQYEFLEDLEKEELGRLLSKDKVDKFELDWVMNH